MVLNNFYIITYQQCVPKTISLIISDRDADETLTWDEYSSIPSDNVFVKHSEKNKDEFVNHMDRNKDGKLDKREILVSNKHVESSSSLA